ncbi:hypothetical protein [Streptomyces chrestomyceticus]|uniref:hypothetical protein n=1 Tax=Streptomyces chrestomyceticus TaxID=68185 RepID=UPI0012B92E9A|nr:hypothetical protein [Streptomyces chrestomyceticus]
MIVDTTTLPRLKRGEPWYELAVDGLVHPLLTGMKDARVVGGCWEPGGYGQGQG